MSTYSAIAGDAPRRVIILIVLAAGLAIPIIASEPPRTNQWGPITCSGRMSVTVKGNRSEIVTNQPLTLHIRIENLSTNQPFTTFYYLQTNPDPFHGLECKVISPSGDVSPKKTEWLLHGSIGGGTLMPGESMEFEFRLSGICSFAEVGTYKITATKEVHFRTNAPPCRIVSNPLYVKVVPGRR